MVGSEIQMRTSCSDGLQCATDCDLGTWAPLTDGYITIVDFDDPDEPGLKFSSVNSKCISITAVTNLNNFWITTATDATDFPCMAADGTGLDTYVMDGVGDYSKAAVSDFVEADEGDRLIEARQVNIEIQAQLTNDPEMRKREVVAINARNDQIYVIPET